MLQNRNGISDDSRRNRRTIYSSSWCKCWVLLRILGEQNRGTSVRYIAADRSNCEHRPPLVKYMLFNSWYAAACHTFSVMQLRQFAVQICQEPIIQLSSYTAQSINLLKHIMMCMHLQLMMKLSRGSAGSGIYFCLSPRNATCPKPPCSKSLEALWEHFDTHCMLC